MIEENKIDAKQIEERFITLETKFAYLEDFVSKLQEVVLSQNKTIDKLVVENKKLIEKINDLQDNEEIPNRRPPHY